MTPKADGMNAWAAVFSILNTVYIAVDSTIHYLIDRLQGLPGERYCLRHHKAVAASVAPTSRAPVRRLSVGDCVLDKRLLGLIRQLVVSLPQQLDSGHI